MHAHVLTSLSGLQVTPPLVCLHEQATDAPVQWAPVLSMLIHNHCHHIPHSAFTHWLQALHSHRFEDAPEPAATLWLLRYVYQLALAWPAALTAAEDSSDAAGDDTSIRLLESHWKVQNLRILDSARHDHPRCVYFNTFPKEKHWLPLFAFCTEFGLCSVHNNEQLSKNDSCGGQCQSSCMHQRLMCGGLPACKESRLSGTT